MRLIIVLFLSLLSLNALSHNSVVKQSSDEDYKVGRYSSVSTQPTNAQINLLAVVIEIKFPQSIDTVGSALEIMLINSGYRLAAQSAVDSGDVCVWGKEKISISVSFAYRKSRVADPFLEVIVAVIKKVWGLEIKTLIFASAFTSSCSLNHG